MQNPKGERKTEKSEGKVIGGPIDAAVRDCERKPPGLEGGNICHAERCWMSLQRSARAEAVSIGVDH